MSIDVQELGISKEIEKKDNELKYNLNNKKNSVIFDLGIKMQHKDVDIYVNGDFLLTAKTGVTGLIKIKKNNPIGKQIINAVHSGKVIKLMC